jgi:hypothetical protein
MKPEDLGIQGYTPEPGPNRPAAPSKAAAKVDPGPELVRKADVALLRIQDLTSAAERIANDNLTLKSAYDRAQATIQRFGAESLYMKKTQKELRLHRALLFGLLVLALLLSRL